MGLSFAVVLGIAPLCEAEEVFTENVRLHTASGPYLFLQQVGLREWSVSNRFNHFAITDETGGATPFYIKEGAPSSSIYIDELGRVGFGDFEVAEDLHVFSTDINATLRLESPESIVGPAQAWNLNGSPFAFTLKDVTANRVPFSVDANTPSNTLYLSELGRGHVGIGTSSPDLIGSVSTGGNARHVNLDAGTGQARLIAQGEMGADFYLVHKGGAANKKIVKYGVSGGKFRIGSMLDNLSGNIEPYAFCLDMSTSNVGIKTGSPTKPLQVGDVGANDGNGAHVTAGGVWTNASSRTVKDEIQPITSEQARATVRALQPVGYRYKNEPDEKYVGFIAEDVPELVATNDRKSLASMDIVAVLTKVVQDQERLIDKQQEINAKLQSQVEMLGQRLADIEGEVRPLK